MRIFLNTLAAAGLLAVLSFAHAQVNPGSIVTVLGPIEPGEFGRVLSHEHVLVDFGGADVVSPDRYDREAVMAFVLPHLLDLKRRQFTALVECTPEWLGRDAALLRELSRRSGLHLLTNTGYYPVRDGQHLPPHAFTETAEEIAGRWIAEAREGIDGTGVFPGFIKIAVSNAPVPEVDAKIVRAAAKTHLATGLTIAVHTGSGGDPEARAQAGLKVLEILQEEGVSPRALIWVHAQGSARDWAALQSAAARGAWISFDGLTRPEQVAQYVDWITRMEEAGYLDHVLVSHDNGWYRVGEDNTAATFKPYTVVADAFIPALLEAGWTAEKIDRLFVDNPRRAFTVSLRPDTITR